MASSQRQSCNYSQRKNAQQEAKDAWATDIPITPHLMLEPLPGLLVKAGLAPESSSITFWGLDPSNANMLSTLVTMNIVWCI